MVDPQPAVLTPQSLDTVYHRLQRVEQSGREGDVGWTFAELSGDPVASAAVRAAQAKVSYWAGDVAGSARFADAGLRELSPGAGSCTCPASLPAAS